MGHRQHDRHPPAPPQPPPREGSENRQGYERGTGFAHERGFGHTPGQRWGNGLNANVERREPPAVPSTPGTDMGMGAPENDRGPHYGKGPKGYTRSDARILEDVCEAISIEGYVDASEVEVKVKDGVVSLVGTVAHRHDKKMIEHLADNVRGVHEVRNEIRIPRPERNLSDERIRS